MPGSRARSVHAIDTKLRSCTAIRQVAERELAQVRGRRAELDELEARLVMTIANRCQAADRLLDERIAAAAAPDDVRPGIGA